MINTKEVGLLAVLDPAERAEVEKRFRKLSRNVTDYLSYLEEEVGALEWFLDHLFKGTGYPFGSIDDPDIAC